jgi:hypothetical protein
LAAFAVVIAVAAAASRRPVAAGVCAAVACLGKETLPVFVLALCLLCARDADDGWLPPRRLTVAIGIGAVVGAICSVLFNVFRFGGARNALYLDEQLRTAGLGRQIEWFTALWVAPSGGVLWFWPGFTLVMIVSVVVAVRAGSRREIALACAPTLVLVAFLVGLALWFAPFGWITFGPRLAVPLLPAVLFAVLWTNGEQIVAFLGRTRLRAWAVVVGLPLLSIPMYGAPWRWWDSIQDLIASNTPSCPGMTEFSVYDDPTTYYRCTSETMWRLRPQILDDTVALEPTIAGAAWLFALAGCGCLLAASLLPFSVTADDELSVSR